MIFKVGDSVYLRKTGEKFTIVGKNKYGFIISDGYGVEFDKVQASEFKNVKRR